MQLYRESNRSGGIPILFEWPRVCRYWRKPKVNKFIRKQKLMMAKFDGCAYGLRSCLKGEEDKFLKKPWLIATNIPTVAKTLDGKLCPGVSPNHTHGVTCGKNAKHSQQYTVEFAKEVHHAIADYFTQC